MPTGIVPINKKADAVMNRVGGVMLDRSGAVRTRQNPWRPSAQAPTRQTRFRQQRFRVSDRELIAE
jgi:hypothetical protein